MNIATGDSHRDVKAMLQDAILAVQGASAIGREATQAIEQQAHDPALRELLQHGSKYAETWRERLAQAARAAGIEGEPSMQGNPIVDAIQQVGGKIIQKAADPTARDLGIIASGQLALHYYVAAFGTMAAYAKRLGLTEVADSLHQCLTDAKRGDERYSELADRIGNA